MPHTHRNLAATMNEWKQKGSESCKTETHRVAHPFITKVTERETNFEKNVLRFSPQNDFLLCAGKFKAVEKYKLENKNFYRRVCVLFYTFFNPHVCLFWGNFNLNVGELNSPSEIEIVEKHNFFSLLHVFYLSSRGTTDQNYVKRDEIDWNWCMLNKFSADEIRKDFYVNRFNLILIHVES